MNIVELVQSQMNLDRIVDVLNYYGVNRVHNFGSTIRCTCPIHGGDNHHGYARQDKMYEIFVGNRLCQSVMCIHFHYFSLKGMLLRFP